MTTTAGAQQSRITGSANSQRRSGVRAIRSFSRSAPKGISPAALAGIPGLPADYHAFFRVRIGGR